MEEAPVAEPLPEPAAVPVSEPSSEEASSVLSAISEDKLEAIISKLAKEMIENHNGTISVNSLPMGGKAHLNTFIVRLPRG